MDLGKAVFVLDIVIALAIPAVVFILYRSGRIGRGIWYLYWAGVLIGMTWEIGFYFLGPQYSDNPAYLILTHWPLHPILLPLLHTLWDGGLFLAGVGLIHLLLSPPHLVEFRWQELGVLIAWGQVSELLVELIATGTKSWVYTPQWWNPVLFRFMGEDITMVPQLIWLVAPILFYAVALPIQRRVGGQT
jgi:hypothetical protein